MSIVVLASAKGSPGVTTTALALTLTWPLPLDDLTGKGMGKGRGKGVAGAAPTAYGVSRVCLVDADLAGSGVAAGYLRGAVPDGGGVVGYAIHRALTGGGGHPTPPEPVTLDETGRRAVLLGLTDPVQARSVVPVLVPAITELHESGPSGVDVLVDLGRIAGPADMEALGPVVEAAQVAVVVCRSTLSSVSSARHLVTRFRSLAARPGNRLHVGAVVVGPGRPYPTRDVARAIGVDGAAEIAWDPDAAAVLSDGDTPRWRFTQSPLLRSARAAATRLHRELHPDAPAEPATTNQPGATTPRAAASGVSEAAHA